MDVTIIGSGKVARGVGARMATAGCQLQILDRHEDRAQELAVELGTEVTAGELYTDPVRGEVVVLAVQYDAVAEIADRMGDQLTGRIVVDITNPVDFSTFDGLVTPSGSSAAQEIATLLPGTRVVKAFNTTFAGTLFAGSIGGHPLDVFIASDDPAATKTVSALVEQAGLRPVEVGPLRRAHELESMGFLHMVVQEPLGTQMTSALKILA